MGAVIYAAPGPAGNTIQVHCAAVDRLAAVSRKLRADVLAMRSDTFESDYKEAFSFFATVRGLAGIIGILAEQPGYRPTDADGQAVRASMAPLKAKVDEITKQIGSAVDLTNPLPVMAAKKVEVRAADAARLAEILHDADNVKDVMEVRDDKTIPDSWKAEFLEELGKSIHEATVEVLKTKHEKQMFDAVAKAIDTHNEDTMVGACLWASQTAASSAGNLPGPNSLYVGVIRIKALYALKDLANELKAPQAVLDDILPHAFDALRLSHDEQTAFQNALREFKDQHTTIRDSKDLAAIKNATAEADEIYTTKLAKSVRKKGSPHAGAKLTGGMTLLNVLCLIQVWRSTPELKDFHWQNVADVTLATVNVSAGICTTLLRMNIATELMTKIVEHRLVGLGIGWFTGVVNMAEGGVIFWDEYKKTTSDFWVMTSGGLQFGSGFLILIGVCASSPGLQLVGVVLGIAATALAMGEDKMVLFVSQLIKQIKEAKSSYDNSLLTVSVGVQALVNELEALVSSCGVTELAFNRNWTGPGGSVVSKDIVHDRLNALGIDSAAQRQALLREVWAE